MASLRDLKLRIKSIKSTQKIARAMEMVAAAKMKKAQVAALAGRPYLDKLNEMISNLLIAINSEEQSLKNIYLRNSDKKESEKKIGYIVISADRGLCGAFNSNIAKMAFEIFSTDKVEKRTVVAVGKRINQTFQRVNLAVSGEFSGMGNSTSFTDILGIAKIVKEEFINGGLDEVYLIYNYFYSTATQKPVMKKLLPVDAEINAESQKKGDYIFEGDKNLLLNEMLERLVNTKVYQAVLESAASEHSARMMAMHKASDNAKEIVSNLTLEYNKTRQGKITTQILEIVGGSSQ